MRLDGYLQRIGWQGDRSPTIDLLQNLLQAHSYAIPFENLDVQLGRPLTTSVDEAYDKIVGRRRGGWCYEQNGLFGWALETIGFNVQRTAATVMRAERGPEAHANHLMLVVQVPDDDRRWLVDVGFGGSLQAPIVLEPQACEHSPYQVGLQVLDDGFWQFWERHGDACLSYDFEDSPGDERAMSERCDFLQTNPASSFVLNLVCQRRRSDTHTILRGRVMSRLLASGTEKRLLKSADEFATVIRDEFRLDVPDAAALWPQVCERHAEIESEL